MIGYGLWECCRVLVKSSGQPRGWGIQTPPPRNSEGPPKSCQTQPDCENCLKIAEFTTPTPQDVRKKGSKILKLPPVRNCFTLAMTNKLVDIINSFKVPKINKILLYEMKFLVPNYSCLQNPWLGGYRPQFPVLSVLCPQLNLLNPPPPNKIPGYATTGECCVLWGRGLFIALITRPEESYRVWCVWVWSWSLDYEDALAH